MTQLRVERDAVDGEIDELRLKTASRLPGGSASPGGTGGVTSADGTWVKHHVEPPPVELRIQEISLLLKDTHSFFAPLLFSATGGIRREATCFKKRLASMLAQKWDWPYSTKQLFQFYVVTILLAGFLLQQASIAVLISGENSGNDCLHNFVLNMNHGER